MVALNITLAKDVILHCQAVNDRIKQYTYHNNDKEQSEIVSLECHVFTVIYALRTKKKTRLKPTKKHSLVQIAGYAEDILVFTVTS